eukprot:gb/GECH01012326.1/.p1 GENE.gb/GECH01012326.1/~~gb/GECH01012326.1/.p1  ORF type:complete len:313 (+),score=54.80 gb/GECH01012326.1/:1-939(+)
MTSTVNSFDTQHGDMIHDAQLDYYGKRLATCSSDRTIKIWEVTGEQHKLLANLQGHTGPVWQVAWGHPKYGSLLASCSYDHKVIIWQESSGNNFTKLFEYSHKASVNSISWAPYELGACLATASADGSIAIISYNENESKWEDSKFDAHQVGCNSVSWAPATTPGSLTSEDAAAHTTKRIVSGGCDKLVKVWKYSPENKEWRLDQTLAQHRDWVRDVAWAPNVGLPYDMIASGSQDKTVIIWTRNEKDDEWQHVELDEFSAVVWRVSWSVTGNILAVSCADNKVTLWKQATDGEWKCTSRMVDDAAAADSGN